ncbi:MAG: alpha/beta hydrolase [Sphingomonas bacterium]
MGIMGKGLMFAATAVIAATAGTAMAESARPAHAAPTRQGPRAVAIDEGMFVDINGVQQWITIRGADRNNPVLLFLHGGPGIGSASMAPIFADWEKDFTIVQWDQPGGGGTDIKNFGKDIGPMTVARFTRDGLSVTEYALKRLGAKKLVLMGNSWGTLIGVEMAQARPGLFSAYVGTSQAVGARGNILGWELGLKAARERGDTKGVAALEHVGPPPYKTIGDLLVRQTYVFPPGLPPSPAEAAATAQFMKIITAPHAPDVHYIAPLAPPPGYDPGASFIATQTKVFDETWHWEARHLGVRFAMPVFMFQGENDLNTPVLAAREYFDEIKAPTKIFEIIPGAGHNTVMFPAEVLALLRKDVLPVLRKRRS